MGPSLSSLSSAIFSNVNGLVFCASLLALLKMSFNCFAVTDSLVKVILNVQIILPFANLRTSTFAVNLAFFKISSSTRVISLANSLKASLVGSSRSLVKVLSFSVNDPLKVSGFVVGFVFVEVSFSEDGSVGSVTGVDSPGVVEAG